MTRSDLWLGWLLTYFVHSTVLLGLVWAIVRLRVQSPAVREVLWRTALVAGLLTATAQTAGWLPAFARLSIPGGAPLASFAAAPAAARAPIVSEVVGLPAAAPDEVALDGTPGVTASVAGSRPRSHWVVLAWAAIAAALLLGFAARRASLARRLGPRRLLRDHPMVADLDDLTGRVGIRRRIVLTVSDRLSSPIAVGVGEICVPAMSLERLGPEERASMLAHELAHLVRFDPAWLTVGALLERLFFFQPLNRIARRAIQADAELLCDEWAAVRVGSSVEMAKCLVKFAEWIDAAPRPVPMAGMAEERSHLLQRVERLLDEAPRALRPRPAWLVVAVTILVAGTALLAPGVSLRGQESMARPSDTGDDVAVARSQDTSSAVVDGLITALRDAHPAVRRAAANALGNLKARRAVAALGAVAADTDVEVRRAAVHALGEIGDRRAVDVLMGRAKDSDREVREAAVDALAEFGDAVDGRVFREWLDDASPEIRARAVHGVGERRDRAAVPRLIELTADPSPDVRQAALQALGEMRAPEGLAAVTAGLRDPRADVRQAALSALDDLDPAELPAAVAGLLGDQDGDVRHQAARLVGEHRDGRAVPSLVRLLEDVEPEVRRAAAEALGEIRTQPAIDALVAALKSKDPVVRKAAAEALGERHE